MTLESVPQPVLASAVHFGVSLLHLLESSQSSTEASSAARRRRRKTRQVQTVAN